MMMKLAKVNLIVTTEEGHDGAVCKNELECDCSGRTE
jgi:hypothetical protein